MAINSISFPQPQAWSAGADFTPLANLGNVYQKAQEEARQRQALAQLGSDPTANAQVLTGSGSLPLATMGINMQTQAADRAERIREFEAQQALRLSQEKRAVSAEGRAASTFEEDSPEGRTKKLVAAGLDPKDPAYAAHIASGAALPSAIQLEMEKRNKIKFEQEQKYATREARLQAVKDGELDINDPTIRRWVALGGEIPDPAKDRLGIGAPLYTQNVETGEVVAHQLNAAKPFVTPPGHRLLGPGEMAQQKAEGAATGKAVSNAVVNLPKAEDDAKLVVNTIDKALAPHAGKAWSVGTMFKDVPALPGSPTANYRAVLDQLDSQTFLEAYNSLKGAGAISNYEDRRASAAKARLQRAQSVDEFDNSLREYKEIVQSGVERMRHLAGQSASAARGAAAAKPDPLGLR